MNTMSVRPSVLSGRQVEYLNSIAEDVQKFIAHLVSKSPLPQRTHEDLNSIAVLGFLRRFITLPVDCSVVANESDKLPVIVKQCCRYAVLDAVDSVVKAHNRDCVILEISIQQLR
jgi:hypothetical protein